MEEEIEEIMGPFIEEVKEICLEVYTPMESADVKKVLHTLGDPYGLALRPQTEDVERQLELVLPEEEVTEPGDLIKMVENVEPISDKAKEITDQNDGTHFRSLFPSSTGSRTIYTVGL